MKKKSFKKKSIFFYFRSHERSEFPVHEIRKQVDVMQSGIGIDEVIRRAEGKVILDVHTKHDKEGEEFRRYLGKDYEIIEKIKTPEGKGDRNRGKLGGIEDKELVKNISERNGLNDDESEFKMRVVKKMKSNQDESTFILEVDPRTQ